MISPWSMMWADTDIVCFDLRHYSSKYKVKFRASESQTGKHILSFQSVLFSTDFPVPGKPASQSVH